jgi:hypothetical protein
LNRASGTRFAPRDGTHFLAWGVLIMDEYDEDDRLVAKGKREECAYIAYGFEPFSRFHGISVPWFQASQSHFHSLDAVTSGSVNKDNRSRGRRPGAPAQASDCGVGRVDCHSGPPADAPRSYPALGRTGPSSTKEKESLIERALSAAIRQSSCYSISVGVYMLK